MTPPPALKCPLFQPTITNTSRVSMLEVAAAGTAWLLWQDHQTIRSRSVSKHFLVVAN